MKLQYLGDVLGSLRYFGKCPKCSVQHMSTHDRVQVTPAGNLCERCAVPEANPYYTTRAQAAYAAAEASKDPRDKAAFRAAAKTWEQLAKPTTGTTYSMEPSRLQMAALKRAVAEAIVTADEPECDFSAEGYDETREAAIAKAAVVIEF